MRAGGTTTSRALAATAASAVAVLLFVGLLVPPGAQAIGGPCRTLADPADVPWTFSESGQVRGGIYGTDAELFGYLYLGPNQYSPENFQGCVGPPGARQLEFPVAGMLNVLVSRKVYVPASGTPFVRWVDFIHNPAADPVSISTMSFRGELGTGSVTNVRYTSNGNDSIQAGIDRWATSDGTSANELSETPFPPGGAHLFDSSLPPGLDTNDGIYSDDAFTNVWSDDESTVRARYANITIAGGATAAFMHVVATRPDAAAAQAAAEYLASGPTEVYQGLSLTELSQIRNWNTSDVDADGAANTGDNCPWTPNSNQANLDGDGQGDVCDPDVDGDGVANDVEAARGLNPSSGDSDGDGKPDGADACPLKFGLGADGCPRFDALPVIPPLPDRTPAGLVISGVPSTMKLRTFRSFLAAAKTTESTRLLFEVIGRADGARITATYNLFLTSRSLGFGGTGRRTVRLRPSRRLIARALRFRAVVRVTATDRAGNRTVKTKTVRVRP
jgi:thrombospondin type 3 repeat protein